jgi:hypothetical protein
MLGRIAGHLTEGSPAAVDANSNANNANRSAGGGCSSHCCGGTADSDDDVQRCTIETTLGDIHLDLHVAAAPLTCANFLKYQVHSISQVWSSHWSVALGFCAVLTAAHAKVLI